MTTMLQQISNVLSTQRIILASGSPRRKLILENIGLKFEVVPSTFLEDLDKGSFDHPADYVKETARHKTLEIARKLASDSRPPDLIIGADTIVTLDGVIYEKPKDKQDAFKMLSKFSGRNHTVYTGICLVKPKFSDGEEFHVKLFHEGTEVRMTEMSSDVINAYIDTGEPMDKAGGYGIQAIGGTLVEGIHGDYFNVMGFPLHKFSKELLKFYTNGL
ncbi:putative bifunctional dTTP/UTP pyrophosphatase/methyltransferase protein [Tubulanus polymorphus]|uniref:putative bifunctional dTTP/UTP pyrophosphatase/methyltransferase protein n=1 Tax=Tubulanus polymorphus TaxID=672921 RepID=UPI003DA4373E